MACLNHIFHLWKTGATVRQRLFIITGLTGRKKIYQNEIFGVVRLKILVRSIYGMRWAFNHVARSNIDRGVYF